MKSEICYDRLKRRRTKILLGAEIINGAFKDETFACY